MLTEKDFKWFLVQEILHKTNATRENAWHEVDLFAQSRQFNNAFEQWKAIEISKKPKRVNRVKHISEILAHVQTHP